jgi:lysozyme
MLSPNMIAFLTMVRHSEGTDKAPDPYRVVFGYTVTLQNLSDHPLITGEWAGAHYTTPQGTPIFTTAAGAYQIIKPTWLSCKAELHLPDFTGPSQDAAAALLIEQKGAQSLIEDGNIEAAIGRCSGIWASLPGSVSGQPQKGMDVLLAAYAAAGGGLV